MLIPRILTAIPLATLLIWIILYQPTKIFDYLLTIVTFIAGYEWARLSGVQMMLLRVLYAIAIAVVPWVVFMQFSAYSDWVIYAAVIWWFSITYYLKQARPKLIDSGQVMPVQIEKLVIAFIVIPATFIAMHLIQNMPPLYNMTDGRWFLMYALALVWVADIGAYFSGKKFGKQKLAPHISPGKTREGLYGAVVATSIYTLIASYLFSMEREPAVFLLLLSITLTFISVSGDLYLSFLKREVGLKDSGNILPGHGGILDRIDSVLAAMPVFVVGFHWLISPIIL